MVSLLKRESTATLKVNIIDHQLHLKVNLDRGLIRSSPRQDFYTYRILVSARVHFGTIIGFGQGQTRTWGTLGLENLVKGLTI